MTDRGAARAGATRSLSIGERAPAKVNLVLQVGARREDGLHELCSLFASLELADEVEISGGNGPTDEVTCSQPLDGPNLAATALAAFRAATATADLPPLAVHVEKRIPVAAGLGGGSADAAAVLRAANELSGRPLDPDGLRELGALVGADVPSQIEPRHALVTGAGEHVEPLELAPMTLLLVPQERGLSTAEVYAEADRIGSTRERLDPGAVRQLAALPVEGLAPRLENDLQPAALSLRPELAELLERLRAAGALGAAISGSGPTPFGVFEDDSSAAAAAAGFSSGIVTSLQRSR